MKIEDGYIIGAVSTNKVGSECEFCVCSLEEWQEMNEEQRWEALKEAAWDSGMFEIYYKES